MIAAAATARSRLLWPTVPKSRLPETSTTTSQVSSSAIGNHLPDMRHGPRAVTAIRRRMSSPGWWRAPPLARTARDQPEVGAPGDPVELAPDGESIRQRLLSVAGPQVRRRRDGSGCYRSHCSAVRRPAGGFGIAGIWDLARQGGGPPFRSGRRGDDLRRPTVCRTRTMTSSSRRRSRPARRRSGPVGGAGRQARSPMMSLGTT